MRRGLTALVTTAAALTLAAGVPGVAGAAGAVSSWTLESVPLPTGQNAADLTGVSCLTATNCVADGEFFPVGTPWAERWNGSTWAPEKLAVPPGQTIAVVNGISCPSATFCAAVGYVIDSADHEVAMAEVRHGGTWTAQVLPAPAGGFAGPLTAVSCGARDSCSAVGHLGGGPGGRTPVVEHWNGTAWTRQVTATLPPIDAEGGFLQGVSCPAATSCTVTGSATTNMGLNTPLAEQWNGHAWRLEAARPGPGNGDAGLDAVSCTSAVACTAAGDFTTSSGNRPMAEHWNGSTWSLAVLPFPSRAVNAMLNGISCPKATRCTAAGSWDLGGQDSRALAEVWNGTTWQMQNTARPRGFKVLSAISCVAPRTCTAVGTATPPTSTVVLPLAEGE